jgi:hypothetical protein
VVVLLRLYGRVAIVRPVFNAALRRAWLHACDATNDRTTAPA